MGRWLCRWSPKYWPKWYRIVFSCCVANLGPDDFDDD